MLKDYFNIYCILLPEKLFKLQYIIVKRCYDQSVLTDRQIQNVSGFIVHYKH